MGEMFTSGLDLEEHLKSLWRLASCLCCKY